MVATHARDRIGTSPWYNDKDVLIACDVAQLRNGNNITENTAFGERGMANKVRSDLPS